MFDWGMHGDYNIVNGVGCNLWARYPTPRQRGGWADNHGIPADEGHAPDAVENTELIAPDGTEVSPGVSFLQAVRIQEGLRGIFRSRA